MTVILHRLRFWLVIDFFSVVCRQAFSKDSIVGVMLSEDMLEGYLVLRVVGTCSRMSTFFAMWLHNVSCLLHTVPLCMHGHHI